MYLTHYLKLLFFFRNPQFSSTSFDRPNFYFAVNHKSDMPESDFRKIMEHRGSKWKFSGPTIVYCITRKKTEELSAMLEGKLNYFFMFQLNIKKKIIISIYNRTDQKIMLLKYKSFLEVLFNNYIFGM